MSKSHNIANLVIIALGIFVALYSYSFLKLGILITPGAGFLPFLCGMALIVLGIVWRIQTMIFKSPARVKPAEEPSAAASEAGAAALRASRIKLCLAFLATVIYASLVRADRFFSFDIAVHARMADGRGAAALAEGHHHHDTLCCCHVHAI